MRNKTMAKIRETLPWTVRKSTVPTRAFIVDNNGRIVEWVAKPVAKFIVSFVNAHQFCEDKTI